MQEALSDNATLEQHPKGSEKVKLISSPSSGSGEVWSKAECREMWFRQEVQQGQSSEVEYPGFNFTLHLRKAMGSVWLG